MPKQNYDPGTARYLSFSTARRGFVDGRTSPIEFLERCLERITRMEPSIQAFVRLDLEGARAAAHAAAQRWRMGTPLSLIDGMPVGIKDCFDVRGWPTEVNSALFKGHTAEIDAAHVAALRRSGAIILGKTTTTELTMALPAPTLNPWDLQRTPGGSSSGSAAAVAACMLPVASGSQVRGSVIRPASICGILGMKPTFGALNRNGGIDPSASLNHLGLLAGTLTDLWETAYQIGRTAGGDPGYPALQGSPQLGAARRPLRLARQYTAGWSRTDDSSKAAFEAFLQSLRQEGVEILEPSATSELATYEAATTATPEFFFDLMTFELRWPLSLWDKLRPGLLSEAVSGYVQRAESMTVEDYDRALARRTELQMLHRALRGHVDGFVTLAHIGPGQIGMPKQGTPWYNDASSAIGAPTFGLPLLRVDEAPLGVQIMGFESQDAELAAVAHWLLNQYAPQLVQ